MKNPASGIALIFPAVGLILIAIAGYMYFQGTKTADIDPLELWLGPAIAGGTGLIFLIIGIIMYFALREASPDKPEEAKLNQNPHGLP